MLPIYAIAPMCIALVGWASISHLLDGALRLPAMAVAIALACAVMTLVRTDGIKNGGAQLQWRWTPSAEERLLARGNDDPTVTPVAVTTTREETTPASAVATPPAVAEPVTVKPIAAPAPPAGRFRGSSGRAGGR